MADPASTSNNVPEFVPEELRVLDRSAARAAQLTYRPASRASTRAAAAHAAAKAARTSRSNPKG